MKSRCLYKGYRRYDRYGGRGIKICSRWVEPKFGFSNFLSDMGKKPTPKHTLDRIDNNGDYTPENCRWVTQRDQVINSSQARFVTVNGVGAPISDHIRDLGRASPSMIYKRLKQGWSIEEAILTRGDIGLKERDRKKRELAISKIRDCLWCGEKVGSTPADNRRKYCNANHYMLHRMNKDLD